jgi:hypothetical protein
MSAADNHFLIVHDVPLSPKTLFRLAPGIRTRLDVAAHVLVDAPDGTIIDLGPTGFTTLSLFAPTLKLGDAIERLEHDMGSSTDFYERLGYTTIGVIEGCPPGSAARWYRKDL